MARLAVHTHSQQRRIRNLLRNLNPFARHHMAGALCKWPIGTKAEVVVSGTHLLVSVPQQTLKWEREALILSFDVRVVDDAPAATTVIRFDVYVGGIAVARLRLDLEIRARRTLVSRRRRIQVEPARSAFASYASEDRLRVLDRISEVRRVGVDVYMDCLSLRPGERWKPALEREIGNRETFLLFWSQHAKASEWVEWEWRTALRLKGPSCIDPHPLDAVSEAEPPEELRELHFGDPLMLIRKASAAQ